MPLGRVLHVTTDYAVPSETFVHDTIRSADDAGWEAHVATISVHDRAAYPWPPDDRLHMARPRTRPQVAVDKLRSWRRYEHRAPRLWPDVAALRPDVVHGHFGWGGLYARPLAARLDVPLVVTFHASDVLTFPFYSSADPVDRTLARLARRPHRFVELLPALDTAIVVSDFVGEALTRIGPVRNLEVLPAGVDLASFPLRDAAPPRPPVRLLYVGRLVRRKGLDVLLRALAEPALAGLELDLEVIGAGPDRDEFEALAARLGVAPLVTFRGAAETDAVARALRTAHVLVVPSRTMPDGEAEGSPVVTKEALAVGLPVVATRSGGLAETIPPALRDELVEADDPGALAARLADVAARALDDPARAGLGRRWVEGAFDAAALGRRTGELYAAAVARRAPAPAFAP